MFGLAVILSLILLAITAPGVVDELGGWLIPMVVGALMMALGESLASLGEKR